MKEKAKFSTMYGIMVKDPEIINIILQETGFGKYFAFKDKEVILYEYVLDKGYLELMNSEEIMFEYYGLTFELMIKKILCQPLKNAPFILEHENEKIFCVVGKTTRLFKYIFKKGGK